MSIGEYMRACLMALIALCVLSAAVPAFAQNTNTTDTTETDTSAATAVANCKSYVGVTNRIAGCVRDAIDRAATSYFDPDTGFYPLVQKAIAGFVTLAITLYGIMAAMGMVEKVGRDTMVLLLKISCVTALCTSSGDMYYRVTNEMDNIGRTVVQYAPGSGTAENAGSDFSKVTCLQNMLAAQAEADPTKPPVGPWMGMDCLIDTVIGIKVPTTVTDTGTTVAGSGGAVGSATRYLNNNFKDADKGLSRGMLYFFFSSMQTSVIGLLMAVIGFIYIYGLVFLVIRALFTYLAGYLGIMFLMIISPLFIPLILFRHTKDYFDKWAKLVISFTLQPIIMLVFISFSIAAVDLAMFSGDYSIIYRIAGNASRNPGFSLNSYLDAVRGPDGKIITKPGPANADGSAGNPVGISLNDPLCLPVDTENPKCSKIVKDAPAKIVEIKANDKGGTIDSKDVGGVITGLGNSKCTKALMDANPDVKKSCMNAYPIQLWHKSIDWKLMEKARDPAVSPASPTDHPGQQISREVVSAAIFCGIVVFIMNGLLKVVPIVSFDLLGDFGQSPNLSSISKMPGAQGMKSTLGGLGSNVTSAIAGMVSKR